MDQFPVVGKQQQSLGILVQAAHRFQVQVFPLWGQQFHHRGLTVILSGGDKARRLVEHHHRPAHSPQGLSIQGDLHRRRINLPAAVLFHRSVHRHPAGFQQKLDLAAGAGSGAAKEFVQSFHGSSVLSLSPGS